MLIDARRQMRAILNGTILITVAIMLAAFSPPVHAQKPRKFEPIPRGGIYDQKFLDRFWTALGLEPAGLTWVKQSETVRFLVTAGSQALRGDSEGALRTLAMLPEEISSSFPFLATMHEDLLIPKILDPWYKNDQTRTMLIGFYNDIWLPHQEYRDDYATFRDDTMGRASRTDPNSPAVWIMKNLGKYGYATKQGETKDDPYLFLWSLLSDLEYFAQRANYYGLVWDKYNPNDWKTAVVAKVGEIIKVAHDQASDYEMQEGYWSKLIDSRHPFEAQSEGAKSTGEQSPPQEPSTGSREEKAEPRPATPAVSESEQPSTGKTEGVKPEKGSEEEQIANLVKELEESKPGPEVGENKPAPEEKAKPEEKAPIPEEKPVAEEKPSPKKPETVEKPAEKTPPETPNEFEAGKPKPGPQTKPSPELGKYATKRLGEIANDLLGRIDVLATDLGNETITLVKLYNDPSASKDMKSKAENAYLLKQQAFLAGISVWDRFTMEIYSPLTQADFDAHIIKTMRTPYDRLKAGNEWPKHVAYEAKFEEAFSLIETGFRSRRGDSEVQAAEEAALVLFEKDFKSIVKEIQDLLSGTVTEPPKH